MKKKKLISNSIVMLFLLCVFTPVEAQYDCTFKAPLLIIDFGAGNNVSDINSFYLSKYQQVSGICPPDGYYSFASYTTNCFNGDWFTLNGDHTSKNSDGNMMLVNASPAGGIFLKMNINGLSGNTTYELAAWMMNVCKIRGGCPPLPPNINIVLRTPTGQRIGDYKTGLLRQSSAPHWRRYSGIFTTPANVTTLILTMEDNTLGGCGNDFAIDDITIRECIKPITTKAQTKPIKPVIKQQRVVSRPIAKNPPVKIRPISNDTPITKISKKSNPVIIDPAIKPKPIVVPLPTRLLTRANPIIKRIETVAGVITLELYDNGIIDGDTVSIYHNNKLIVSGAALSDMPINVEVKIDVQHPHHELIMVAENLGAIPPNTSLMVVTENNKRSEVFISSSEEKNARVVIDLK